MEIRYEKSELLKVAKPILFNTPMVKTILEGRKTVTRRVIKPQPDKNMNFRGITVESTDKKEIGCVHFTDTYPVCNKSMHCKPPYQVGDILYVRETFCEVPYEYEHIPIEGGHITVPKIAYKADAEVDYTGIWKPSIHMPKEAARIFLKVTDVRVERLQDITAEQALAEGVSRTANWNPKEVEDRPFEEKRWDDSYFWSNYPQLAFSELWDSIIKKQDLDHYGWKVNPWVWVIEFSKQEVIR